MISEEIMTCLDSLRSSEEMDDDLQDLLKDMNKKNSTVSAIENKN